MSATTTKPKRAGNGDKVYEIVTDRIMEKLNAGTIPWRRPFRSIGGDGQHRNLISQRAYRGINVFLLDAEGYAQPWWLTMKQANSIGGHVRKGESPSIVTFWKRILVTADDDYRGQVDENGKRPIFLLRYFKVWNVAQVDGIDEWMAKNRPPADEVEPVTPGDAAKAALDTLAAYRAKHSIGYAEAGDVAGYMPFTDRIAMPTREAFDTDEAFVGTAAHEHVHSTGHSTRLDRADLHGVDTTFGSEPYAREELVAEMGAAMFVARHGLDTPDLGDQSAAYIANWLQALANDKRLVVMAAARAGHAVDLLCGDGDDDGADHE